MCRSLPATPSLFPEDLFPGGHSEIRARSEFTVRAECLRSYFEHNPSIARTTQQRRTVEIASNVKNQATGRSSSIRTVEIPEDVFSITAGSCGPHQLENGPFFIAATERGAVNITRCIKHN